MDWVELVVVEPDFGTYSGWFVLAVTCVDFASSQKSDVG
jgi:hypothetical protein